MGVDCFADGLLIIPKTLASNCGYDVQDTLINLIDTFQKDKVPVGVNCVEYGTISPEMMSIYDNYCVKR